ncbi:carbohydrate kinase family protein [Oceaniglobus roseus]|uniref:carbohydrate kinase family protein n=1 Tax=Oceaniglobus roseus TaxID=1737570 RepID=UPI0012FFFEF1|nr:carbohydrate kinase family protein [Kandeliimicrobium roseum]
MRPVMDIVGYASIDRIETGGRSFECVGGAAIYAALSAVRLGVTPRLCIAVGEDFPDSWLHRLAALGIDTGRVDRRQGPSRRTRLRYGQGEARQDSASRSDEWWARPLALAPPLPPEGGAVTLLCPLPPERVAEMRAACGGLLVADTSEVFAARGAPVLDLLRGVDVFAPSLDEAQLLTGETEDAAILSKLSRVAPRIILKRGTRGLMALQDGRTTLHESPPEPAVDPTGAGDACIGAIAAAIALGLGVEEQLAAGASAGALTVGRPGPEALGWRSNEQA